MSLVGGVYIIVAKVLANRLNFFWEKIISNSQNAFIRGRQILDSFSLLMNSLIAGSHLWESKGAMQIGY
jgi:hypothetical protein